MIPTSTPNPVATPSVAPKPEMRLPNPKTMECAMKIAIEEDRPIMMDYWADSLEKIVLTNKQSTLI